jgi:hypothetical protein
VSVAVDVFNALAHLHSIDIAHRAVSVLRPPAFHNSQPCELLAGPGLCVSM